LLRGLDESFLPVGLVHQITDIAQVMTSMSRAPMNDYTIKFIDVMVRFRVRHEIS